MVSKPMLSVQYFFIYVFFSFKISIIKLISYLLNYQKYEKF